MTTAAPQAERDTAQRLFEEGCHLKQIGKTVGRHPDTVKNWARRDGWVRPDNFYKVGDTRRKVQHAHNATRVKWALRQGELESELAELVQLAAKRVKEGLIADEDPKDTQRRATTLGILIDKAIIIADRVKAAGGSSNPMDMDADELEAQIEGVLDRIFPAEQST